MAHRPHCQRPPHALSVLGVCLSALPLVLTSLPALAAEGAAPPGLPAGAALQALFGLLLVLALIAGVAFIIRRLPGTRAFAHGALKVVGGIALGPRERIVLLEVGDTWLVVGIAPGQIRTLHTLPKGEAGSSEPPPNFNQWLRHFVDQRNGKNAATAPDQTPHA